MVMSMNHCMLECIVFPYKSLSPLQWSGVSRGPDEQETAMRSHPGIMDREQRGGDAEDVFGAVPAAGGADCIPETRAAWAVKIAFLLAASALNTLFWMGVAVLALGSSWGVPLPVVGLAIWLLSFCALALCASG